MRRNIILMVVMFIFAACGDSSSYNFEVRVYPSMPTINAYSNSVNMNDNNMNIEITSINENGAEIKEIIINNGNCNSTWTSNKKIAHNKKMKMPEVGEEIGRTVDGIKYFEANKDILVAAYTKEFENEIGVIKLEGIKDRIKRYYQFETINRQQIQVLTDNQIDDLAEAIFEIYNPMREKLINFAIETIFNNFNDELKFGVNDFYSKSTKLKEEATQKEKNLIESVKSAKYREGLRVYLNSLYSKEGLLRISKSVNGIRDYLRSDYGVGRERNNEKEMKKINEYKEKWKEKGVEFTEEQKELNMETTGLRHTSESTRKSIGKLPQRYMTVYKVKSVPKQKQEELPATKLQYGKTIKDTAVNCPNILKVEIVTTKGSETYKF